MTKHSELTNIHVPYNWTYADETAREAATGFATGDVGKLARQLDDNSLWMLTDDDPVTWVSVGGGGSAFTPAFGIVERTAGAYTTTSDTFVDVDTTNVSISITTGARRCRVGWSARGGNGTNGGSVALDVTIDGTRQGQDHGLILISVPSAANNNNLSGGFVTDVLTAASHTFKLQWSRVAGVGTARLEAATTTCPLIFWVEEMNLST